MHIHESVFWGILGFLIGVGIGPVMGLAVIAMVNVLLMISGALFAYQKRNKRIAWFAALSLCISVGAIYWNGYNVHQLDLVKGLFNVKTTITGHVTAVHASEKSQQLTVQLDEPNKGRVAITVRPYPVMRYGDVITATGVVRRPEEKDRAFLMRSAVFASMLFPEVSIVKRNDGNGIMMRLFDIRQKAVSTYAQLLPAKEAALLGGITLGERADFSAEFKQQMANSGTTHLVALSGYNISVVAEVILAICGYMMRRKAAFFATLVAIVAFVVMAGAEASVVRAAIMGSIALLAGYIGRAHSMRNAIAVSACAMVLWNPNVLRYDLGFQLSFLALLGIVYLKPHMDRLIKRKKNGLLEWRENLSGTLAAQMMVFPVLMQAVGSFSVMSLLSNIAVLAFIPVTMGLGFAIALLGFVAPSVAAFPAWIASLLLKYEIAMIELFGTHKGVALEMTGVWIATYFLMIGGAIFMLNKRKTIEQE